MSKCAFVETKTELLNEIGGAPTRHSVNQCSLKKSDNMMRLKISDTLFQQGIGGSFATDVCPIAGNYEFEKCPFFKQ